MKTIREISRRRTPFDRPQGLAWGGSVMWMTSVATGQIYAVEPSTLAIRYQTDALGTPWGIGSNGQELRVVIDDKPTDRRIIRKCGIFGAVDPKFALECPEGCGSHLSWAFERWHLSQWYPQNLLRLSETGAVEWTLKLPRQIVGHVYAGGQFHFLTTEKEETHDYWLMRYDPSRPTDGIQEIAHVPFQARALAHDGRHYWTNHREQHETVVFTV